MSYKQEQERLLCLFEEVQTDCEEIEESNESFHDSETEPEMSDHELEGR